MICLRIVENCYNNYLIQVFAHLLTFFLAKQSRFYLGSISLVELIVSLAISKAISIKRKKLFLAY